MSTGRRAGVVILLSAVAIELHELGHRAVFFLIGTPARIGFQRVDPTVPVSQALWLWGKTGRPLVTLVLSVAFVAVARRRWLGVIAVYLLSLAVGIGAVIADDLLGIHGH